MNRPNPDEIWMPLPGVAFIVVLALIIWAVR
jgi:hypothetical protein